MNRLSGLTNAAPTVCAACRSLVSSRLVKSFSQMRSGALKAVRGLQSRLPNSRGYPFRSLFGASGPLGWLGLDESFAAIVLALVFFNYSVIVRTVGALWSRLDPRADEAARVLGADPAALRLYYLALRIDINLTRAAAFPGTTAPTDLLPLLERPLPG